MRDINRNIRYNFKIRVPEVRVIGADGNQLGVMSPKEGIKIAQEDNLDLVEVSPNAKPPVCKIMDYGKYVYDLNKKEKEAKKKQKVIHLKEVKIGPKIEEHDYQTKLRNARRFLSRGDRVKVTMFFRGREKAHAERGEKILDRFVADIQEIADLEKRTKLEGSVITMILVPKT